MVLPVALFIGATTKSLCMLSKSFITSGDDRQSLRLFVYNLFVKRLILFINCINYVNSIYLYLVQEEISSVFENIFHFLTDNLKFEI